MFKKNGGDKLEFDRVGTFNAFIRLVVYAIGGLIVYFNTIGDIKTRQAVIVEKQTTICKRIDNIEDTLDKMVVLNAKLDSVIIELRHLP